MKRRLWWRIWQRVLDYLKEAIPPVIRMYIDFSDQRAKKGQTITTRIPGVGAAYDASSGYTPADVTDVDRSVTASNFKAASALFTVSEMSSTNRDLVDEHAAPLASTLAEDLLAQFYAVLVDANFTNATTEAAADVDDDTARLVRKKLNNRNAPRMGRLGLLNGDAWEAFTGDSLVTNNQSSPSANQTVSLAPDTMLHRGITWFEANSLPGNAENLIGAVLAPGSIIGATGVPRDANEDGFADWADVPKNAAVRVVSDIDEAGEGTGISLLERRTRKDNGNAQLDYAWIFGFAKGQVPSAELIQSA